MDPVIAACVLLLGSIGGVCDLRTRHIPNWLTFGGTAAALAVHTATAGLPGAGAAAAGWATALVIFVAPFALGGLGAGDVKLLAALGAWFGPREALWLCAYTAIAGGVLSVAVALAHGSLRQTVWNVWLLLAHWRVAGFRPHAQLSLGHSPGPRLAYGVAILSGTVGMLWLR